MDTRKLILLIICLIPLTCFARGHHSTVKTHFVHTGPAEVYVGPKPPLAFTITPEVVIRTYYDKEVFGSTWLPSWIIFWARSEQTHTERIDCKVSVKREECQ